jgi:hypothetical protein
MTGYANIVINTFLEFRPRAKSISALEDVKITKRKRFEALTDDDEGAVGRMIRHEGF